MCATAQQLQDLIGKTASRLRFLERHDAAIRRPDLPDRAYLPGPGHDEPLFRTGHSQAAPYLIAIVPGPGDLLVGAEFDLQAIQDELARTVLRESVGPPGYRLALLDDRDAVTQAILNLLSNAVKYSPGEKEIGLRIADAGDCAIVEVTDRGIGTPVHEQTRIFEPYYRADTDQLKVSGAGLGLTVVQHVMDAHHGRVEVESSSGRGTSFRLVFPRPSNV